MSRLVANSEARVLLTALEALDRHLGQHEVKVPDDALLDFGRRRSSPPWRDGRHFKLLCGFVQRAIVAAYLGLGFKGIIQAPPRHGKSHILSVLGPVWGMGTFSTLTFGVISYGRQLSLSKSHDARTVFREVGEDEWGLRLNNEVSSKSDWRIAGALSRYLATSIESGLTGEGLNVGIMDDPYKNEIQAYSPDYRDKVYGIYRSVMVTRMEPGAARLIQHTRWHDDDLIGRVLREEGRKEEGGDWEVLDLPAECQDPATDLLGRTETTGDGACLWPERWNWEALQDKKRSVGPIFYAALYLQRPRPDDGGLFASAWYQYAALETRTIPAAEQGGAEVAVRGVLLRMHADEGGGTEWVPLSSCWSLVTVDPALSLKQTADYFVAETWLVTPAVRGLRRRILVRVSRSRTPASAQTNLLWREWRGSKEWTGQPAAFVAIEKNAAGLATVQLAMAGGLPVREVDADRDKVARAMPLTGAYQAHQVFHLEDGEGIAAYESELLAFPTGEHDDQVDPAAYMEQIVREVEIAGDGRPKMFSAKKLAERRQREEQQKRLQLLAREADPTLEGKEAAAAEAIARVHDGQLVEFDVETWPYVRTQLQQKAGFWLDHKQEVRARIALDELYRCEQLWRAAQPPDAAPEA